MKTGRVGARSSGTPSGGGLRSVRPPQNTRGRQQNLAKSPWAAEEKIHPAQRQKATGIENMMRYALLRKGINFIEQAAIGPWCIDFYLPDHNACVEADGEYWHGTPSAKMKDRRKDLWLQSRGYEIYHFDGWDIKQDADFCVSRMMKSLEAKSERRKTLESKQDSEIEEENTESTISDHEERATNDIEAAEYERWLGNAS